MGFNNGPKLVTQGLDLLVDAADPSSYPGSGTVWTDLRSQTTGSLTGSVSYTSVALLPAEAATMYTLVQAYQTTLGRQV